MDNSALGIHIAAMAATWSALTVGWLGVRFTDAGPEVDPRAAARLPRAWRSLSLKLAWRGRHYPLTVPVEAQPEGAPYPGITSEEAQREGARP
jgi:trehalose/maltose hydrolase-like predicted phosphorylase